MTEKLVEVNLAYRVEKRVNDFTFVVVSMGENSADKIVLFTNASSICVVKPELEQDAKESEKDIFKTVHYDNDTENEEPERTTILIVQAGKRDD